MRGNDTSVRIEGDTGKIRTLYFEQDDDDDDDDEEDEVEDFSDDNEDVLTFQVDSLQEIDSLGMPVGMSGPSDRRHGLNSLASQIESFNFSALDNSSTYQGLPVKNVNLTVALAGPQANLELIVMVFLRSGKVTFGNETFRVESGTLKFNIKISDWQFCGGNETCTSSTNQNEIGQYLDLQLSIKSMAEEPEEVDDEDRQGSNKEAICDDDPNDMDDDCPTIFNMGGNAEMVLNKVVLTGNNEYLAFPPGFPKFVTTGMTKSFSFRIPRFNNTCIIDPSVNVGAPTRNQQGGGAGGGHNAAESLHFFSFLLLLSMLVVHY